MRRLHFKKDDHLFKIGDVASKMYIIQAGEVEISLKVEDETFILERLGRGSIISHRSFIQENICNTDAKASSTVTVFALDIFDLNIVSRQAGA